MIWKHQRIRQHDILPPTRRKNHNLGNILGRQRLHALIHLLRLIPISTKPHNAEFRLHLPRIDLDDADARGDEFAAHGVCKGPDGGLGGTIDAAALVGFAAGDAADVDDVAGVLLLEDGQDGLGHGDEAGDVCGEHGVDVGGGDGGGLGDAFD